MLIQLEPPSRMSWIGTSMNGRYPQMLQILFDIVPIYKILRYDF